MNVLPLEMDLQKISNLLFGATFCRICLWLETLDSLSAILLFWLGASNIRSSSPTYCLAPYSAALAFLVGELLSAIFIILIRLTKFYMAAAWNLVLFLFFMILNFTFLLSWSTNSFVPCAEDAFVPRRRRCLRASSPKMPSRLAPKMPSCYVAEDAFVLRRRRCLRATSPKMVSLSRCACVCYFFFRCRLIQDSFTPRFQRLPRAPAVCVCVCVCVCGCVSSNF